MEKSIKGIIAKNIADLRKKANMTQADLSEKLYYSNKAVSKWERGVSVPDADVLFQIAELFGVDIKYLFIEHDNDEIDKELEEKLKKKERGYKALFFVSFGIIIFTMFLILMLSTLNYLGVSESVIFLFLIPVIPTILLIINLCAGRKRLNMVFISVIIWSLAHAFYSCFAAYKLTFIYGIALVLQISFMIWPKYTKYVDKKTKKIVDEKA